MPTRYQTTLILIQPEGPNIEINADGDEIYFNEHGVLGGWQFSMSTSDWTEVKRFIESKIGEDIIHRS